MTILAGFVSACTPISQTTLSNTSQPANTAAPTETSTATLEPTSTITPFPTATATPTLSPTPDYFAQANPLSEVEYVIPLTVRHTTKETATFFFELQNPVEGIFVYRNMETQFQEEIPLSPEETRQMITIEGLTPGTKYEAQVLLGNAETGFRKPPYTGESWGAIQFRSLPDGWPIRVGVLGDASFGDDATRTLVERMAAQDLDFVIHTGDVVYETDPSDVFNTYLQKFYQPFSPLLHQGPIYTVLGNHDYDASVRWEGAPFYDYAFPPFPDPTFSYPETRRSNQYYAIAVGDLQFILLDTHVFAGAEGRSDQDAWLEERLADPRFRVSIPVFHASPFSSSVVHPDDGRPVRLSWNWRFENANVPLVLSGHFHHYERLISNGITYVVSGGGSSTLYALGEPLPVSQVYARKSHFVLLEFYADHIDLYAISSSDEIIDQFYIVLK